jgi:hypothetical protein
MILDLIVSAYRLIPARIRSVWSFGRSTSHLGYGGWPNFRSAVGGWFDGWDGISK